MDHIPILGVRQRPRCLNPPCTGEFAVPQTPTIRPLPDRTRKKTPLAPRNNWIRTFNLFLATAETAEIDPATHLLLFGPLRAAEAKSAKPSTKPSPAPSNQSEPLCLTTSE